VEIVSPGPVLAIIGIVMSLPDSANSNHDMLRLENVCKVFQMGEVAVEALRNLTLDVRESEFLVTVGPSGSGKTTLLNIIGGLDTVSSGRVWFRGREMTAFNPAELTRYRRDTVGFIFQFYNLVPNLTARENVMVSTELSREPMDVAEALRLVGLEERLDHFPSQMSGGEQQRVAIARALAKNPALLLCDEPTGALDFETGKRILRLLVDLKHRLGMTIILITHNNAIAQVADRVIRLRSGEMIEVHENPQPLAPEEVVW
jgi:putative ABC transport system ATP-binding protein